MRICFRKLTFSLTTFLALQLLHVQSHAIFPRASSPRLPLCDEIITEMVALEFPILADRPAWFEYYKNAAVVYKTLAKKIYLNYIAKDLKPREFVQCLHARSMHQQATRLEQHLPNEFFFSTIHEMSVSHSKKIQAFAADALDALNSGQITFLGLDIPSEAASGSDGLKLGGFHRGQNGLYINPNDLPSSQWTLIFVHEFSHALDNQLREAVQHEMRWPLVKSLEEILAVAEWTPENEVEVRQLLRKSLDRGFLAEYRSWVVSASLYLESGRSPRVPWFDRMLGEAGNFDDAHFRKSLFDFLDPRFQNKLEGIFQDEKIQRIYFEIRASLRKSPPEMGSLEGYVRD